MLEPPQKSENTVLKVPTVQWERRDGDMPCDTAALEGQQGARDPALGPAGRFLEEGPWPTTTLFVRPFLLRTEVRTVQLILFP